MILSNSARRALAGLLALAFALTPVMAIAPIASAEPYETTSSLSDLPVVRALASTVVIDNELYVIGGTTVVNPDIGTGLNTVIIYNIGTGDVTYGATMPTGVSAAAYGLGNDGKIYIAGGWTGITYTQSVQIYDPDADSWSVATNPVPTYLGRCASTMGLDGRLYVFGSGWSSNVTMIYTPSTDTWRYGVDLPILLDDSSAVAYNSTAIFLLGGNGAPTNRVWVYDTVANSYTEVDSMNHAKRGAGAAVGRNGEVYSFGGTSSSSIYGSPQYSTIERYNVADDAWTDSTFASLNYQISNFATAVDSYGRIFVVGGQSGASVVGYVQMILTSSISEDRDIKITSPLSGSAVHGRVVVTAEMVNSYGGYYQAVDLYVDGAWQATQYGAAAMSFVWDTTGLADGSSHVVMVRAFDWDGKVFEDSVTVTMSVLTQEEVMAALQNQIGTLQMQLAEANGNITTTLMALAGLGATFATLQSQLDDMQDQVNRIEDKADTAGMYSMINLVLVIIVLVLLALMLVMARKKP